MATNPRAIDKGRVIRYQSEGHKCLLFRFEFHDDFRCLSCRNFDTEAFFASPHFVGSHNAHFSFGKRSDRCDPILIRNRGE